ncbi:MAG: hypothetical protein Kow0029_05040 [Candidatus Rifleibacteriota bacterium]
MICSSLTAPGTIRERNQDYLLVAEEMGMAVLADGVGPNGEKSAELLARTFSSAIREFAHLYSADEALTRLCREFSSALENIYQTYPASIEGFASLWVHRGKISLLRFGKSRILCNSPLSEQKSSEYPDIFATSMKCRERLNFLLISEGIAAGLTDKYLDNLSKEVMLNPTGENLQLFWNEAAIRYDGDDRSMIAISIEKADASIGEPHELVLCTDLDRQYSIPLWIPASIMSGLGIVSLFVAKKVFSVVKTLRRHFPRN